MRLFYKILTIVFVICFFACSNNPVKKIPKHLTSGMKEIKKGNLWHQKGCYKRSLEHFLKAHELFSASDQLNGVAMSMNNIGNVHRIIGNIEDAELFFEESFTIYNYLQDNDGAAQALSNKAATLIDGGMFKKAEHVLNAVENIKNIKQPFLPLLNNKSILFIKKKEYKQAEKLLKKSLANTNPANYPQFATVNFIFGSLMFETQQYEKAIDFFNVALSADRNAGFHKGIADDLSALGSVYVSQNKNELAVNVFKRAVRIYALIGNKTKALQIMDKLFDVSKKAQIDISLTKYFIKKWLENDQHISPCG